MQGYVIPWLSYYSNIVLDDSCGGILKQEDTKSLYKKALLSDSPLEKLRNFSGINDPFEKHQDSDYVVNTGKSNIACSAFHLFGNISEDVVLLNANLLAKTVNEAGSGKVSSPLYGQFNYSAENSASVWQSLFVYLNKYCV